MQAVEVRRVSLSEDLSRPGDYVFIEKRAPRIQVERLSLEAPKISHGWLIPEVYAWVKWMLFGKKYELKQIVEFVWPDYDTIILNCPECNGALAMPSKNKIVSIEPLTIEFPLTCPYCKTKTFTITEGKLIAA
jgi:hypothetical protein